jgi:hypothetical protein
LFQTFSPGIFFFSSRRGKKKHKEKKNHKEEKKCKKGKELSFKLPFYLLTFGFYFYLPNSTLLFQTFSPGIFFFSSRRKEKKNKGKKTIEKKNNAEKGGSLPSSFLSFLAPTYALLFLPFHFKHFLLGIFLFSSRNFFFKKNTQRKKKPP